MKNVFEKFKKEYVFLLLLVFYILLISFLVPFRDMIKDEALYFHETFLIAELFKTGQWIGPYGVGIHGFLFKIPPALLFLLTGPSVEIVTIYHILLTVLIIFLSYKLFSNILENKTYALLSTTILLTNFHFFVSVTTYLREIPLILVILLFLNHIIEKGKKNKFLLSLLFLLLLDVKEYAFVIFVLFYLFWLFLDSKEENFFKRIWDVVKQSFVIFLPSLIWMILMFTTHIIPVNMFLASLLGLKDDTFRYLFTHFDIETSTYNALEGGRNIYQIPIKDTWYPIVIFLSKVSNVILAYIGKISYPRVFSFLSIPKVVIFPAVASAILTLKEYILSKKKVFEKKKELKNFALLSTLLLTWLLIYVLRASHGRYLLPVVPVIAIIYVYFLFKQRLTVKQKRRVFVGTLLYVALGLCFETSYFVPKMLLEFIILTLFLTALLKPHLQYVKYLLVALLSVGCLGTAILFSYIQGQIYGSLNFGTNRNAKEIAQLLPDDEKYWINGASNQSLISVYNGETYINPEWKWRLHEIVPIRDSLKTLGQQQSFTFPIEDMKTFRSNVEDLGISQIVMISTWQNPEFYTDQRFLLELFSQEWLQFQQKEEYRGMDIYVFTVVK